MDEQLHENVEDVRLVDISDSVADEGPLGVQDREKSGSRVDLEEGGVVVR